MTAEQALALRHRGLPVIPVPRPRPEVPAGQPGDGKTPSLRWGPFQKRLPTEVEIRRWFATEQNIAIVTGALSGVVAVDLDSPAAASWWTRHRPYTPWQTKTARGFHVFYRHPDVPITNRSRLETSDGRLAIDVRGDGGFVIGPGSVHASGVVYEEAGDWSVAKHELPVFWSGWLQRRERPASRTPIARPTGDVVERARRYLAAIPRPEIGHGSDAATLYAACRLVRGFELSELDAIALLWEWAGGRLGWTHEWVAAKVAHALRYGSEPVGALR